MKRPKQSDYSHMPNVAAIVAYGQDMDKYVDHLESKDNSVLHSIMQESDSERLLEAYNEHLKEQKGDLRKHYLSLYKKTFLASNGA